MRDTNLINKKKIEMTEEVKTKHRSRILKLSEFQLSFIDLELLKYLKIGG